jgi:hypothetical protein
VPKEQWIPVFLLHAEVFTSAHGNCWTRLLPMPFYPFSDSLYNLVSLCLIKLGIPSQAQRELLLKCFTENDVNYEFK